MRRHRYCIVTAALSCLMMAVPVHADYDASVTQQVQQKLNEAGFDCGMPDGVAGAKTEEAIRAFQESRNLTSDGVISEELLEALGLLEEGQETSGEENTSDGYLDAVGDRYYTPGEDLLLFNLDGLKVILKGEQSETTDADGFEHSIGLAVEVVNEYDMDFDICFGIDFDGNQFEVPVIMNGDEEYYAPFDLCIVPAHGTAEGVIWGEAESQHVSLEELQSVKLYFTLYDSDRVSMVELGPITVHYQGDDSAAKTEAEENGASEVTCLFEGADMAQYTGNWTSLAPSDTGLQDIEICVPEDWSYSATDMDGFTVGKFLSSEAIVEMQEYLSAHPGEAYTAAPEGIAALITSDPEITGVLNEMAEEAKTTLISDENGRSIYEMDEAQIEEKALAGENDGTDVESKFFYYVNDLRAENTGSTYWIYDRAEAAGALVLTDMEDPEAKEALQSLRMSGVKNMEEKTEAEETDVAATDTATSAVGDASALHYIPGEDLVLYQEGGVQVILKGDQPDAQVKMPVEVVNDSDMDLEIRFGLYSDHTLENTTFYSDDDNYAFNDLCVAPAHTTVEGSIWEENDAPFGELEHANLYFAFLDTTNYWTQAKSGLITAYFS